MAGRDLEPHNRAGTWYLIRRVPKALAHLDPRGIVRVTTGISVVQDPRGTSAKKAVAVLNDELEAFWRGLRDGRSAEAKRRYDSARARAKSFGFEYAPAREGAALDIDEVVRRMSAAMASKPADEEATVAAILGGEEAPPVMVSSLLSEFEAMQEAGQKEMSEDQKRKWRNPKKRALANLLEVVGDKAIKDLTRNDALDFRAWWAERIMAEQIEIGTANKDIGHINKMLRTVDTLHRLGLQPVFGNLRIEGEVDGQRTAYDPAFVQKSILAPGALEDLNEQARRIVYLIADTGLRLSEACNLTSNTIHLNAPVPFIEVRPEGRKMKTEQSARDIPLVGAALAAMRLHPEGFPRYRDKAARLSALVNKALDNRGLRPKDGQSLYSLRHTFEDRLTAVEAPEKLIAMLMGHKFSRPRYGVGPSLEQKQGWLAKIAFTPPDGM